MLNGINSHVFPTRDRPLASLRPPPPMPPHPHLRHPRAPRPADPVLLVPLAPCPAVGSATHRVPASRRRPNLGAAPTVTPPPSSGPAIDPAAHRSRRAPLRPSLTRRLSSCPPPALSATPTILRRGTVGRRTALSCHDRPTVISTAVAELFYFFIFFFKIYRGNFSDKFDRDLFTVFWWQSAIVLSPKFSCNLQSKFVTKFNLLKNLLSSNFLVTNNFSVTNGQFFVSDANLQEQG